MLLLFPVSVSVPTSLLVSEPLPLMAELRLTVAPAATPIWELAVTVIARLLLRELFASSAPPAKVTPPEVAPSALLLVMIRVPLPITVPPV